jgi:adenylate cyclase
VRCSACAFENPPEVRFCGSCGAALSVACPTCGAESPSGFRFCGSCGSELGTASAPAEAPRPGGERRRVTVLFADLVGFSTLAEHLDPEELRSLMTDTFSELTEEVESRDGFVEKFIGDAVVAIFGAPVTHEDDPVRAVEAATAMLDVVQSRSEGIPTPLELRIGINSGLVVAGAVGDGTQTGVMGDAVNVAARLQQSAEPGQVLLAASTWRRVRDRFDAAPIGALEVKGKAQPVEAYRLVGPHERGGREQAPFVGRREELALLELLWSSVRKGNTHVVSVVGEPGVGKSRLLGELRPEGAAREVRVACGGERAFGPFLAVVETILGGTPCDLDDLKERAAQLGVDEDDVVLLGSFLGLAGAPPAVRGADEQRKQQVFAGVWKFLLAVTQDTPTFVAIEDVHWADESSRELLEFLLERLSGAPLMLVLSYRPGLEQVERAELRASHTAVRLEPLSPNESVELARGFLGVAELPADLERLVAARAEGNPFFIEELLQALVELGSLAVVDGRAVLAKVEVEIPDTVQGTILARIDRLDARTRSVLQHAAVLGRGATTDLLEAVVRDGSVDGELAMLARAQLLVVPTPGVWAFKHALIQEVTYETLLLRHRRELHEKVARALEERAGVDPSLLEALAEHYAKAEAPEQARRYAVAAGDLAAERMGVAEAKRHYETALRLWGEGDEEGRLRLLLKLGRTATLVGDEATARTVLLEAEAGWEQRGDPQQVGSVLAVLGRVYWRSGDAERGFQTLARAIGILEELGPSAGLVEAYSNAASLQMLAGNDVEGSDLARRGLELADELDLRDLRAHLLNTLGVCEVTAGRLEGVEKIQESLELSLTVGDAEATGRAYNNLASMLNDVGQPARAAQVATEGVGAARRLGLTGFEWFIAGNLALALVLLGRLEEAEGLARQLLEEQRAALGPPGVINAGVPRATALTRLGRYEEARAQFDELLPFARGLGGSEFLARLLADEAELELARGNEASARQAIREATQIALANPSRVHPVLLLPSAARLLPADEIAPLLERVDDLSACAAWDAMRAEAIGTVGGDRHRLREAARLYRECELPYECARCLLDAGELEQARELIERHGFGSGPLGARLVASV